MGEEGGEQEVAVKENDDYEEEYEEDEDEDNEDEDENEITQNGVVEFKDVEPLDVAAVRARGKVLMRGGGQEKLSVQDIRQLLPLSAEPIAYGIINLIYFYSLFS